MDQVVSANEVRSAPRVPHPATVEALIHPLIPGQGKVLRRLLLTQDISATGCNIVHAFPLAPGQRVDLLLDNKTQRQAVVVWCKSLPSKHYSIGCRYVEGG
jgi:hypothetical protein